MIADSWHGYAYWALVCALGTLVSLTGEFRNNTGLAGPGKLVAATAYLAAALSLGASSTGYGRILLVGMAWCWLGDMFLISRKGQGLFLAGLACFLMAHIAFAGAFALNGISLPALLGAAVVMTVFAWRVLQWLKPSLDTRMRRPVLLYVLAISLMMTTAAATFAARGSLALVLGALLFLVSDLSVARNRFVAPGFINRAWGLPVYFTAQLLLAASVAAP